MENRINLHRIKDVAIDTICLYDWIYHNAIIDDDMTDDEIYEQAQESAMDNINHNDWEVILGDILDCGAYDFEDLFWNIVAWYPKAYTNSIKKFQHSVQMFLTPAAVGVYRDGKWHEVYNSTSEF